MPYSPSQANPDLTTRLRFYTAYASKWSSCPERTLVTEARGKNGRLEDWLRDAFFSQHVKAFDNRPFLWHILGRSQGWVLGHRQLPPSRSSNPRKADLTTLGAWIERQKHETAASRAGADKGLAAAEDLQNRLKQILDGAPPHDVYVRWKELHEQPIGWHPDLDDGYD